jgi:hypothetical protein
MPGPTVARRAFLSAEWREATSTDAAVKTAHPLAPQVIEETLLVATADAQDEADRRQVLRGVRRDMLSVALDLNDETSVIDLGAVVQVTHARFGLAAGTLFRVVGVEPDAANQVVTLTVWG